MLSFLQLLYILHYTLQNNQSKDLHQWNNKRQFLFPAVSPILQVENIATLLNAEIIPTENCSKIKITNTNKFPE